MCLIVFAYKAHPQYDLVFAANRDEAYQRPTRAAQFWNDHPRVMAGKDLQAGGTWMGINKGGQLAALTNYRDPSILRENPPSRGKLVLGYLTKTQSPVDYLKEVHKQSSHYMGFNLLAGTIDQLFHYSNHEQKINPIKPGIHGLSNHLLDTPWPKVKQAKMDLDEAIHANYMEEEQLFNLLQNEQPAPDEELPDTGIPKEIEKQVSPIFIKSQNYGTRSSTLLLIDKQGKVTFEERRFKAGTRQLEEKNQYTFQIAE